MKVREALIIRGTETKTNEGINHSLRALVRVDGNEQAVAAYVKSLDARGCSAEIFCSLLCRHWGLDVPEVAIVRDTKYTIASLDTGYPNLKQRIGWSDSLPEDVKNELTKIGAELVSSFDSTPTALAIDEAINNRDRNLGNILWDGANVAWIDHERSLGFAGTEDLNKLVSLVTMTGQTERIQRAALAIALTLTDQPVKALATGLAGVDNSEEFRDFILGRLPRLANMVIERFPRPCDLLSGVQNDR